MFSDKKNITRSMFYLKITILCLVTILLVNQCLCVDPVLTPSTLTDNVTNSADADSTITWAGLPAGKEYKTDATYDDGGMGPLFDFARSFINTAMAPYPSGIVNDVTSGKFDFAANYTKILQVFAGYAAALVIGFLFIIIFPIIGCCFCCCRCCGNCGGKMLQKTTPSTKCRRHVYSVILLVLVVFTAVGSICVFVSNDRMSTALDKYGGTVSNNLDDITSYLDNTVEQIHRLLVTDLGFTFDVVNRDLDNIDVLVGIPVRDDFDFLIKANTLFDSIGALQTDVDTGVNQFDVVETDVADFKAKLATFDSELAVWTTAYNASKTTCDLPCTVFPDATTLPNNIDPTQIDTTAAKADIDKVRSEDMNALVDTARTDFNDIPKRVKNDSTAEVDNMKNDINNYKSKITPLVNTISNIQNTFLGNFNLNDFKDQIKSYTASADPYDQYRWYGGVGLTCIILLVVILQFIGLAFGFCGSGADTLPTERGCMSTAGGNMLMASVGFIFIFSSLLMLLTTLSFLIGAPLEKYICQTVSDPNLETLTQLLKDTGIASSSSGSWLGGLILGDSSIDLTLAGMLQDCGDEKTAYTAFKLEHMSGFNLTKVTNYKQTIGIENKLNNINVDFSTMDVAPQSLTDNMEDFKNSITALEFAKYQTELNKDATGSDLNTFVTDVDNKVNALPTPAKNIMEPSRDQLIAIRDGSYTSVLNAKNKLSTSLANLKTTFDGIPANIDKMLLDLTNAEFVLAHQGNTVLNSVLTDYMNRIFRVVDTLIERAVGGIKNDVAICTPVSNLYQSVVVNGLCKYMIDAFNGFWFSIGWCIFFFVPSTIFAVKLAKHFRKMKSLDNSSHPLPNKVGHKDGV